MLPSIHEIKGRSPSAAYQAVRSRLEPRCSCIDSRGWFVNRRTARKPRRHVSLDLGGSPKRGKYGDCSLDGGR